MCMLSDHPIHKISLFLNYCACAIYVFPTSPTISCLYHRQESIMKAYYVIVILSMNKSHFLHFEIIIIMDCVRLRLLIIQQSM